MHKQRPKQVIRRQRRFSRQTANKIITAQSAHSGTREFHSFISSIVCKTDSLFANGVNSASPIARINTKCIPSAVFFLSNNIKADKDSVEISGKRIGKAKQLSNDSIRAVSMAENRSIFRTSGLRPTNRRQPLRRATTHRSRLRSQWHGQKYAPNSITPAALFHAHRRNDGSLYLHRFGDNTRQCAAITRHHGGGVFFPAI